MTKQRNQVTALKRVRQPVHLYLGKKGEELTAQYCESQGMRVIARNVCAPKAPKPKKGEAGWRAHGEIDLVVLRRGKVFLVEVKTRKSADFGEPELMVDRTKVQRLYRVWRAHPLSQRYGRSPSIAIAAVEWKPQGPRLTLYWNLSLEDL